MPIISISLPSVLLEKIDEYARRYGYTGRSEFIREALRDYISSKFPEELGEGAFHSLVVVLTDHRARPSADRKIIDTIHLYQALIKSFYHQMLGDGLCINIAVIEASWREIQPLLSALRKVQGVVQAWFIPLLHSETGVRRSSRRG